MRTLPRVAWLYLRLVTLTSRLTVYGDEHPRHLRERGTGFIYAFWHARQVMLVSLPREERVYCLVSSSRDGEYVARVLGLFGKETIRGSTTRGGFEAMKEMLRTLRSGGIIAVTPDGPVGPPRRVKPGVIQMAGATGSPIVPVAFDATRMKVFASWDGYCLPLPWCRIAVVFGEPFTVDPTVPVETECRRLEQTLDAVTADAAQRAGVSGTHPGPRDRHPLR